ncbi:hypothetical protein LINPERPRIM_LOCUS8923 [Linum perenne]
MKGRLAARCGDGLCRLALFSGNTTSLIRGVGCVTFGLILGLAFTGLTWHIPLSTSLRGGALLELRRLLDLLDSLPDAYISAGPASKVWPLECSGRFSVGSLRRALIEERYASLPDFPSRVIWQKRVPSKIQCFMWMVWHGRIASIDNQRRGMVLTNWCVLCERDLESVDHLFVHCSFASTVWSELSSKLFLNGPRNDKVRDWIGAWKGMNCISRYAVASKIILHGFLWFIWLERNARIFTDTRKCEKHVAARAFWNFGRWLHAAGSFSSAELESWYAFIFDPR